jgi:hypothetical protein
LLFVLSHDEATGARYVTVMYQVQTIGQIRNLIPLSLQTPPALERLALPGCGNAAACPLAAFTALVKGQS